MSAAGKSLGVVSESVNGLSFEVVRLSGGTFQMGTALDEMGRDRGEVPHLVEVSGPIAIGKTEVSQALYEAVMGTNPSGHQGCTTCPVEMVSWVDATRFCNKLSELKGLEAAYAIADDGSVTWNQESKGYRLPTEAEWEYAARAGTTHTFAGSDSMDEVGWYVENSKTETQPVATKKANDWGLHDMSGNVSEWVWDWMGAYPTGTAAVSDPLGPISGIYRVYRGGTHKAPAGWNRIGFRVGIVADSADASRGFRIARSE